MTDILLITPPFTQLNTPYPATSYLKGFLNTKKIKSFQMDLGIEVILELFSKKNLEYLFQLAYKNKTIESENTKRIYALKEHYLKTIEPTIAFLQGNNNTLSRQIYAGNFLPQASRFNQLSDQNWAFGTMGILDQAKHLATLYLEDISDFIVECIDENFGFSRYAEKLGRSANSFDELYHKLQTAPSYIDDLSLKIVEKRIVEFQPRLICFSVPFPGNLFSAFRCAQFIKQQFPAIKIAMGGGFPSTELRSISDPRVFDFFDYIILDDGELPLELLISNLKDNNTLLKRTFERVNNVVIYKNESTKLDYKQLDLDAPDYSDLLLNKYISVIEIANPMHSLWTDGRWNKLTMAHGCYWGKCTFCDGSLDYIKSYHPNSAIGLVNKMEKIIAETGENGFHFIDEAAPPALLKEFALEIIKRKLNVTWWTNIRFEKSFTLDICQLLQASGCIAVSGGLEVASERLLKLINKGVTVEQVAQVTHNFTQAGIMVHAYLMYGFPSQTIQETVDSLEMARQLFDLGCIQSGFWHQFALTAHSPVGLNPEKYNIKPKLKPITFANNDVDFTDKLGIDHAKFSYGLKKSLYNFMHNNAFDFNLQEWFDFKIPKTSIKKDFIRNSIAKNNLILIKPTAKIIWIGNIPATEIITKSKKGRTWEQLQFTFHKKNTSLKVLMDKEKGEWFLSILERLSIHNNEYLSFEQLKNDFEKQQEDFELFWYSKPINTLRMHGLIVI